MKTFVNKGCDVFPALQSFPIRLHSRLTASSHVVLVDWRPARVGSPERSSACPCAFVGEFPSLPECLGTHRPARALLRVRAPEMRGLPLTVCRRACLSACRPAPAVVRAQPWGPLKVKCKTKNIAHTIRNYTKKIEIKLYPLCWQTTRNKYTLRVEIVYIKETLKLC
jgi:hypothetical protein